MANGFLLVGSSDVGFTDRDRLRKIGVDAAREVADSASCPWVLSLQQQSPCPAWLLVCTVPQRPRRMPPTSTSWTRTTSSGPSVSRTVTPAPGSSNRAEARLRFHGGVNGGGVAASPCEKPTSYASVPPSGAVSALPQALAAPSWSAGSGTNAGDSCRGWSWSRDSGGGGVESAAGEEGGRLLREGGDTFGGVVRREQTCLEFAFECEAGLERKLGTCLD